MNKILWNKVIDGKGRVLIPQALRDSANIRKGDIVRLGLSGGNVTVRKLDIIEVGDESPAAREAFVFAAVKYMDKEALLKLLAEIAERVRWEGVDG